jgi:hypothetical protein
LLPVVVRFAKSRSRGVERDVGSTASLESLYRLEETTLDEPLESRHGEGEQEEEDRRIYRRKKERRWCNLVAS